MLAKGNAKLGKSIWSFSIPAGDTCPGKSEICSERCYAQRGFFVMPSVKASQERNHESTLLGDFVERMTDEIRKNKCNVVRIHVAGDFYSAAYARKWLKIIQACPDVTFFAYTRSWNVPAIFPAIEELAKCKNLRLWFSVDDEMGKPPNKPKGVRLAYMAISINDIPNQNQADLVFRDYGIRGVPQKRVNGVIVCPPENGVTDLTCEKCGICWQRTKPVPKQAADKRRVSLQLAA